MTSSVLYNSPVSIHLQSPHKFPDPYLRADTATEILFSHTYNTIMRSEVRKSSADLPQQVSQVYAHLPNMSDKCSFLSSSSCSNSSSLSTASPVSSFSSPTASSSATTTATHPTAVNEQDNNSADSQFSNSISSTSSIGNNASVTPANPAQLITKLHKSKKK